MISGEPEDEADFQFRDLERIFCRGEMICRGFCCFPAGSWRFAGLNCAISVAASCGSNAQPHLQLFATSHGAVVLLWVVCGTGGWSFFQCHLETCSVSYPLIFCLFVEVE